MDINPKTVAVACGLIAALAYGNVAQYQRITANAYAQTSVIYNQDTPADVALITQINAAHLYAYFVVYTFTKTDIADALVAAKLRGVDVRGVLDPSQATIAQEKPIVKLLQKYGIPLEIPQQTTGIVHMKILVTENSYASGSFNWTASATEYNDEVLEIGYVRSIHDAYLKIFNEVYEKYK